MASRRLAAAALSAMTAAAGCGDDGNARSAPIAKPLGQESAGASVQFADCGDWRHGTHAERLATIEQLRGHLTPGRSRTAESPLSDQRSYEVFERACAPDYASSFRLYKLYGRAQGFAPLSD